MLRILRTMSQICLIGLLAGCSATMHGGNLPGTGPTGSAAAGPGAPGQGASRPAPVAKVTAACPLLPATTLKELLGGSASQTRLTAVEDKPDLSGGYPSYNCQYGSNGRYPFALGVSTMRQAGYTPAVAIGAIAKASPVATRRVPGVGTAAVFYTLSDGVSILAAAKQSRGETRMVIFAAPRIVPGHKFIQVTRVVLDRL